MKKGRHVKNISIIFNSIDGLSILRKFLKWTPKLEEFVIDNRLELPVYKIYNDKCLCHAAAARKNSWNELWTPDCLSVDLPALKVLKIELRDLTNFIKATKQIKTLEKLSIFISTSTDQSVMTEFILQQHNLKELNLIVTKFGLNVKFPTREIISEVKFKLNKLKILTNRKRIVNNLTDHFLLTQASSLEEIEFDSSPSDRTLVTIFYRFKQLKKFTQRTDATSLIVRNIRMLLRKLQHVTYYEDMNTSGISLNTIVFLLPVVSSVKCIYLNNSFGDFPTVNDLDVNNLKISNLKYSTFENLKNLTIKKLMEVKDEKCWRSFARSIESVNNLSIKGIENVENLPIILKNLTSFKKLQKFSFLHNPGVNREYIMKFQQSILFEYRFYEILIDMDLKTIKISSHIVEKRKDILDILAENFKDFEFFEICVKSDAGY